MTSSYNNITGTDSANTLIGSTGSDSFAALSGDDNVLGGGSDDIVDLGGGNDSVNFTTDMSGATVYGKGGNDSLGITVSVNTRPFGGSGNDTLWMTKGVSATKLAILGLTPSALLAPTSTIQLSTAATLLMPPPEMVLTASISVALLVPLLCRPMVAMTPCTWLRLFPHPPLLLVAKALTA